LRFSRGQIALISFSWTHWPLFSKFSNPHKSHDQISLTPFLHLTKQKIIIQHIDFPQSLLQESLQRITPIPSVIDLVDSMDYCSPLEFPKSKYSFLKNKTIKTRYKQNTNTDFWKELLAALDTSKTFHHSPFSTIIPNSKIDILLPWVDYTIDCLCTFPQDKDLQNLTPTTSLIYNNPKIKIKNYTF
jgi:hypothetical protein